MKRRIYKVRTAKTKNRVLAMLMIAAMFVTMSVATVYATEEPLPELPTQTIEIDTTDLYTMCGNTIPVREATAEGTLSYTSSNPEIAEIDEETNEITVHTAGTVTITVTAAATEEYAETSVSYDLIISHNFSDKWEKDENGHWHVCECGAKSESEDHVRGLAPTHNIAQLCQICQYVMIPALGHEYGNVLVYDAENHWYECECGKTKNMNKHALAEIVKDEAKAGEGNCEHGDLYFKTCIDCGYLSTETFAVGEVKDHVFTNYVSDGNATCAADGTKTAKCDICGTATDTLPDLGNRAEHTFTNYVSDNNATCTFDGTKTAKCDFCDATDTQTDAGSKKAHSFTNYVSDNNATCEADGTKTAKCDSCDETDTQTDAGSKKAHSFEKGACVGCGAEDPDYVNLTWLWIVLVIVVVLGGGFALYWFVIRKK